MKARRTDKTAKKVYDIRGEREMTTFALFYGNRAFMPDEVIDQARPKLEKLCATPVLIL